MKIGDYVHYTYRNYLVNGLGYGTGGNTNVKSAEANEIFKQHKTTVGNNRTQQKEMRYSYDS